MREQLTLRITRSSRLARVVDVEVIRSDGSSLRLPCRRATVVSGATEATTVLLEIPVGSVWRLEQPTLEDPDPDTKIPVDR